MRKLKMKSDSIHQRPLFPFSVSDKNVQAGKTYWYKLEDIDSGGSTQHGPVSVDVSYKKNGKSRK